MLDHFSADHTYTQEIPVVSLKKIKKFLKF